MKKARNKSSLFLNSQAKRDFLCLIKTVLFLIFIKLFPRFVFLKSILNQNQRGSNAGPWVS